METIPLLDLLSLNTDLSKTVLKDCLIKGCVWLKRPGRKQRRVRRAKLGLLAGDKVSIYFDRNILNQEVPEPVCLADKKEYSVWDKPAGMLSQGTRYGDHCSLLRIAEKKLAHRLVPHLVHRLDREAQGIVLLAHGKKSASLFSELFRNRRVIKRYQATVQGVFNSLGTILEIADPLDGKPAQTSVKIIKEDRITNSSLIDVEIHTGRYHQIRRHLSGIGHPLTGDRRYNHDPQAGQFFLKAYELGFICPFSRQEISYHV